MKKRILVVDDDQNIVELVRLTLGDEYDYIEANSGIEAIKKAKESKPDLILLDIMMPGMDGYEVCQKLRTDPETKEILIAMLSAKKEDHDILEGIDVGAIAYITKPFNATELVEKVEELLEIGK
ncbi:response regulator [Candidatus Woesearchaeota archaeon]|nr:response regulator [Candidatus Woesearchaeota archaeon]